LPERDVLDVIVLVAGDDVEDRPAVLLLHLRLRERELAHHFDRLLVRVGAGGVVVEVGESRERLHVELLAAVTPIESLRHEVVSSALFQDATLGHPKAGPQRHLVIGILDQSVPESRSDLAVVARSHAVEFENPVRETGLQTGLAGPDDSRLGVPGDDRLGPGSARRRADLQDLVDRVVVLLDVGVQGGALREDRVRELDESRDVDFADGRTRAPRGPVLERPHAAAAHVAESLDGVEGLGGAAPAGEPRVDQRVAVAVRQ